MAVTLAAKIIALTGGASGIGLATATSRGVKLSIADVNLNALDLAQSYFVKQGVGDRWIKNTVEQFGRLDGSANCAGVAGHQFSANSVADVSDEQWNFDIGVYLTGMEVTSVDLFHVFEGSTVSVALVGGQVVLPKASAYSVIGLVRSVAQEFGSSNICINAVVPGAIQDTGRYRQAASTLTLAGSEESAATRRTQMAALGRTGTSAEVAELIALTT
ncbi:hypothetical protein F5884DRAFT_743009 [Xylogone sp. PMI_703]|nr:hypothetical protein F5884DRAFT_743009 [Xylogone sp. PMI_703]